MEKTNNLYLITIYPTGNYYGNMYYYVVAKSKKQAKFFLQKVIGFKGFYFRDNQMIEENTSKIFGLVERSY